MSRKQWIERADEGLSMWATWKLQSSSAVKGSIGYPSASPIARSGLNTGKPDYEHQDYSPEFNSRGNAVCRAIQTALDVMPAPLAETLTALWLLPGSQKEIAQEIGVSFNTMRERRMQGLLFLEGWLSGNRVNFFSP